MTFVSIFFYLIITNCYKHFIIKNKLRYCWTYDNDRFKLQKLIYKSMLKDVKKKNDYLTSINTS